MTRFPTPISVLETYFGQQLTLKDMSFWKEISDDTWVDFAKTYLAQMKAGFTPEAMAERIDEQKIRLYFEFRFGRDYDREIVRRYTQTPLLGLSGYPGKDVQYGGVGLSQILSPLAKHLLVADELYIPDNFYRCFDAVADSYDRTCWRDDPMIKSAVHHSIAAILLWLPILAGLRDLITSGAITFFPYYKVPSFPYFGAGSFLDRQIDRLIVPDEPGVDSESLGADYTNLEDPNYEPKIVYDGRSERLDCNGAVCAWINARLLGLDPVFADERTWRWASGIKFREETKHHLTTDLMSIDILPLGNKGGLNAQDIVSMRKGEQVFRHIRDTLIGCKDYVHQNVSEDAASDFLTKTCREYVRDHLNSNKHLKAIKFLDNNLYAGTALSIGIGVAFMAANPWVGLLVPAALTPKALLAAEATFDPRARAAVRLEALL
jgi:hypothetical protein